MSPAQFLPRTCVAILVLLATVASASATWSIVIADSATKEVAMGTVTCLNDYDLLAIVPVIVVGKGAAACQAAGDFDGVRRPIIFNDLINGVRPGDIITELTHIAGNSQRQYGIADTQGRRARYTGSACFAWAGAVGGLQGTMAYTIQGNILAGDCVVPAIEQALLNTPGDVPTKLMAAMEAAGLMGGDGRCSCDPNAATSCGCPPPSFVKPGHIGGMIVARLGDTDDPLCNFQGCADGDYFMRLDVPFQTADQPDPVVQLRGLFDAWRAALVGRPDAIQSVVTFDPPVIPPNGTASTTLHIALRDVNGQPITVPIPIQTLTVAHAPASAALSTIGTPTDTGNGTFTVTLTAGTAPGLDLFLVTVNDGIRPVLLTPFPRFQYLPLGDMNCDGVVNGQDIDGFVLSLVNPAAYPVQFPACNLLLGDFTGDGLVLMNDIDGFVTALFGG